MNSEEKFLKRWEKSRKKGKLSYIIRWGLLFYGGTFFLIWTFLAPFIENGYNFSFIHKGTFILKLIVFGVVSSLFGLLMGYLNWGSFERRYKKGR